MKSRRHVVTLALLAPLVLFLIVNFALPVTLMLMRGLQDRELAQAWPNTAALLRKWNAAALPDGNLVVSFTRELQDSQSAGTLAAAANRLNYDKTGMRSLLFQTARALPLPREPSLATLRGIDPRWGEIDTWLTLKHAAGPHTSFYLLAALDSRLGARGELTRVPAQQAVFIEVFTRTFQISLGVTLLCMVLGYPLAYLLASLPRSAANPLLILLLLPFWTSVLVRTTAWMVLLQNHGVVNDLLLRSGLLSRPLELLYNRTGVYISMTHVLLPYFVLPLYGVMKNISFPTMRAALSLGATPLRAFWQIYLPQTLPGITAGALIVFILALGYYITPALVGGADDQMISYFIAFYTNQSLNWGMAAALSLVLFVATLALVTVDSRVAGMRQLGWR